MRSMTRLAVTGSDPTGLTPRPAGLAWCLIAGLLCFTVLAVGYEHDPIAAIDREVAEWVAESLPGWAEWLGRPPSWFGGGIGMIPICVGLVLLLLATSRVGDAVWAAVTLTGIHLVVTPVLKEMFDRPRPDEGSAVPLPSSDSLPSGHASGAVVTFGVLAALGAERWPERARLLWTGAALVALAVGASRVVLNVHFVTDVVAGFCLGLAWLAAALLVRGWPRYPFARGRDDTEPRSAPRGDRGPARLGP
jgi:undecaprenyl-diphosphatase